MIRRLLFRLMAAVGLGLILALTLAGCAPKDAPFPDDGPTPAITKLAALSFLKKAVLASKGAVETKTLTLTLTDSEVTSFLRIRAELTQELKDAGAEQFARLEGLDLPSVDLEGVMVGGVNLDVLHNLLGADGLLSKLPKLRLGLQAPEVHFLGNGQVVVRGTLAVLNWERPTRVVVAPYAAEGELALDFVEGQVGRAKMPAFVFDLIGKGVARALLAGQEYAEITQIQVGEGTFTISGRFNQ